MSEIPDTDEASRTAEFLQNHPRMLGVLFTMAMILSSAGTAVAGGSGPMGP